MDIRKMTTEELVKEFDIVNKVIDYHYEIRDVYRDISDITSGVMTEHIGDLLYDEFSERFGDYDYDKKSKEIMEKIEDEVVKKIFDYDEKAREDYEAREEGRKGNY